MVERYLPAAAAAGLAASVARVVSLCSDDEDPSLGVQYLQSAYLPSEDTCFCVFRAMSADDVRKVNGKANFPLDRITDAVVLLSRGAQPGGGDATDPAGRSADPLEGTR